MRWIALLVVFVPGSATAQPSDAKVTLESLSYSQLGDTITALKGKVVLVEVWGEFCLPCKKAFPHFVAIHHKYAEAGLTAVSVSLDDPTDPEAAQRAKAFLVSQKATCRNILVTDSPAVWQAKWKIVGPPAVFLFDKKGQLINRWADREIDYGVIEKRVAELLKE